MKTVKEQSKLSIKTLDCNVPRDHISRFVVDFIEEDYPILNINEAKKKKGRDSFPVVYMLKLLVYTKIEHVKVLELLRTWQGIMRFISSFLMS